MARVGRVSPPRGRRRWVGRGSGRSGRRLGSAHPRLHRVPVVGQDESLEHLVSEAVRAGKKCGRSEGKCAAGVCGAEVEDARVIEERPLSPPFY